MDNIGEYSHISFEDVGSFRRSSEQADGEELFQVELQWLNSKVYTVGEGSVVDPPWSR
jgi:hypothetical protein